MKINRCAAELLLGGVFLLAPACVQAELPTPDDSKKISEVIVRATRDAAASISGITAEPSEIPLNIRLIGAELIEDIGATRIADLVDLAGGTARQNTFGGLWDNFAIRGFAGDVNAGPDLLINRFQSNRGYNAMRDVATIERFEVIKGPASALSGKGEPGGSINIVTKAPLDHPHAGLEVSAGSYDNYRGSADVGGPVTEAIAVRMVAVSEDNGSFRDTVDSDRKLLAPSIAFAASDALNFLYQLEYSNISTPFDRGVVAINNDPKALPRERFLAEPTDGNINQRSMQHQGSVIYDLSPGIALEAGIQYRDGSLRGFGTEPTSLRADNETLWRQRRFRDYAWDDLSGRLELSAKTEWLGLEHQMRIGSDAYRFNLSQLALVFTPSSANPNAINIWNPVYGQPLPALLANTDTDEHLLGQGFYAQDLISIGDRVTLLLGLRHDHINQELTNNRATDPLQHIAEQDLSATTPRAAITFAATEILSLYASFGRSFRHNQGTDYAFNTFDPERGRAYETGFKYALYEGRVNGTLSAFDIVKENMLTADADHIGFSRTAGEARSRGIEFDINAKLNNGFTLTGVYALLDTEVLRDTDANLVGSEFINVPRHSAALATQWRSSENDSGYITLGGGITYVGVRAGNANNTPVGDPFQLPSYTTARLNLGYQFTPTWSAHIDIDNLFDTYYVESSLSTVRIIPGTPRTAKLRLRADF